MKIFSPHLFLVAALAVGSLSACKIDLTVNGATPTSTDTVKTESGTFNCTNGAAPGSAGCTQSYVNFVEACPGFITDTAFGATGADDRVAAIVYQRPSGSSTTKLILGGHFQNLNGTAAPYLARLNTDGSIDSTFAAIPDSNVSTIALDAGGNVVIGGDFSHVNSSSAAHIARLNPASGSLDTTFASNASTNGSVAAVAPQSSGKIVVGGDFTLADSASASRIARLNSDGSLDTAFAGNATVDGHVLALAIQTISSVDSILVGGSFTHVNGTSIASLARLHNDGTLDTGFTATVNGSISTIRVQADGKILLGGAFTQANSASRSHLVRLNADGTLDTGFTVGSGFDGLVDTLAVQQLDGKILVGGDFTHYNGTAINRVARLNSDGSIDTRFYPGSGADALVTAVVAQPFYADGSSTTPVSEQAVWGGDFANINDTSSPNIARFNAATNRAPAGCTVLHTFVASVTQCPNYNAVLNAAPLNCGPIATSPVPEGATAVSHIEACPGFIADTDFVPAFSADGAVLAMARQSDGKLVIGGDFTVINGSTTNHIARLNADGTLDSGFEGSADNSVKALVIQNIGAGEQIVLGGDFLHVDGVAAGYLARLNPDGTLDTSLPHTDGTVRTLSVQPDSSLILGGDFTQVGGIDDIALARIPAGTNVPDPEFTYLGSGFSVQAMAAYPDGTALMGYTYTATDDSTTPPTVAHYYGVVRLLHGYPDTTFNIPYSFVEVDQPVSAIVLQPDGKILLAGAFTTVNGNTYNHLVRLHGNGIVDTSFTQGSGFDGLVSAITVQPDGQILVAGDFTHINGTAINRVARLNSSDGSIDPTLYAGSGINGIVHALLVQADGKIDVGGSFTQVNGNSMHNMARLNARTPASAPENCVVTISYVNDYNECPYYDAVMNPTPFNCILQGTDGMEEVFHALPDEGNVFQAWGGDNLGCAGQTGICNHWISPDDAGTSTEINITANFQQDVQPQEATYTYNYQHQRKTKTMNGVTTYFVYSDVDGQLLGEYTADGSPIREYAYADGERVAMFDSTGESTRTVYLFNNQVGQAQLAWGSNGQFNYKRIETPFHETMGEYAKDGLQIPVGAVGMYRDNESGFLDNWNRSNDPRLGRYIQSDQTGLVGGLNTYGFVEGNPVMYFDPYGLKVSYNGYAVSNQAVRDALENLSTNLHADVQVTGGDRYIDSNGNIRSASNDTIIGKSAKKSSHLIEEGARGVDVDVPGKSDNDIADAAGKSGFDPTRTIPSSTYPGEPHNHLEVPKKPCKRKK
ncbi:MAG TPA: RHS repeat-associated core domain-containing protein [Pseudomonadales bacterium]|nr:RHS repeat-associated core domain-containing protein [Pseudomonadales bacterium]